ncbi:hypothetical protein CDAR_104341 [Caerostris darwini]|uniref:Uncharacterized protein n=1 Tax=Caerostris darwini TaxID=1538125 RepID=A0AAV4PR10_9ARAC|nr:hypothetical protein CDAR_104341 [Caerostris darwini]
MVSVPVVGSTDNMATSWNSSLCSAEILASDSASYLHDADSTSGSIGGCDDERMLVDGSLRSSLTVNAIVTQESGSRGSENSEDHLSVVDNITAQNFLQESDLMNAASSALGHKKSPSSADHEHNLLSLEHHSVTSSQDHMEMQSLLQEQQDLDGSVSNYHLDSSQTSELSIESTSHLDIGSNLPEVVPGDGVCLSPSSNSSASSLDLSSGVSVSSNIGLPPVSTIIRSSAKGRFDAFCRPSNINLIMGIPQYLSNSNSFDVMTSMNNIQRLTSSPCDSLNNVSLASPMEVSSSRHNACTDIVMESVDVPLSSSLVCSSTPLGQVESRCIKANTVMSSLGPDMIEKDALSEMTDSEHGFDLPSRTIHNFVNVVPLREILHISTSPSQHLSPMAIEEMQKVAEISEQLQSGDGMDGPFSLHSSDESIARVMLSPHFSVENSIQHADSYVNCISQRSQPTSISAIETNVIMSTSNIDSSPKFTAAEIKAIEQRLTEHSHGSTMDDSMDESALDSEVIIPDCIETSQSSDIIYSDVHDVLSGDSEERKILKAHNVARSTIIEKNLLQQTQIVKNEPTVITSAENLSSNKITAVKVSQNNNSDIITIRMAGKVVSSDIQRDSCVTTVNPSPVTASVIQQLLRTQSPPTKLRTNLQRIPKGVITSVMSTKGDAIIHQDILVPSSSPPISDGIKKEETGESGISVSKDSGLVDNSNSSKDKLDISEHSVISHGSKSPSSSDEKEVSLPNITTTVLPSLFSNLSASALASLQSSLSSALPLTSLPNISIGDSTAVISHLPSVSPTLSSPPLSPILLPSILSSTLRNVSSGVTSTLLDSIVTSNCVTSTNSMYTGLLKTVGLVKQEPGSGPLPPFTVVHGLSPLVKRSNLIGANPTSAQIPVVTIKQEPGSSRASMSASEFNPSIILNAGTALPGIASIHLPPAAAAVQLPVVVTSSVAISTSALTNPVPSQASTIAFAGSTPTSTVDSSAEKPSSDKKWNCLMCKNGSPCGLHPTQPRLTTPPQPVLSELFQILKHSHVAIC